MGRSMERIAEITRVGREAYCGAIGFIGLDGQMETNIAIRTGRLGEAKLYSMREYGDVPASG